MHIIFRNYKYFANYKFIVFIIFITVVYISFYLLSFNKVYSFNYKTYFCIEIELLKIFIKAIYIFN